MAVFNNKYGKNVADARVVRHGFAFLGGLVLTFLFSNIAHAGLLDDLFGIDSAENVSDIAENIVTSSSSLPGLITGISYLLALLFGVTGILKLKDHVENPSQTPLRVSMIRFIIGGALLALPMIYEAMTRTITGANGVVDFEAGTFSLDDAYSGVLGTVSDVLGQIGVGEDFNFILAAIVDSIEGLPGLISAAAYLLALLFGVLGLLKLREHVENPDQTKLKEGVVRLLIGGALFAIPNIYETMQNAIVGDDGAFGSLGGVLALIDEIASVLGDADKCDPLGTIVSGVTGTSGFSLGSVMCNISVHAGAFPAFLTAISYLFGIILGFWGILKIKEHALNPSQTSIWEGVSRFIAAGCFFTLPAVVDVMKATVAPVTIADAGFSIVSIIESAQGILDDILGIFGGGSGGGAGACEGLDGALSCFMSDIAGPFTVVLNLFALAAGTVLIMIGISRLMKSAQEGARAPGGIGTIMTFLTGGILISYNEILGAFTTSLFNTSTSRAYPVLAYDDGLSQDEVAHVRTVIVAVLQFMTIIGLISFVRGIFLVRGVAEGNSQASLMAAVTHLVGGALAVNLGPLMNAVQATLGITGFGVSFVTGP